MSYYPVFLDLEDKTALVIGGGMVAERKVKTLIGYGALVRLVSRDLTEGLRGLVNAGDVEYLGDTFHESYLDDIFLVFAATNDHAFNRKISEAARSRGILVNAVDQPADCNFIVPAVVKRGHLQIAVSTSGKSPAFAKLLKEQLESQFGKEYEIFMDMMGAIRDEVLSKGLPQNINKSIFSRIVSAGIPELIRRGDWEEIRSILCRLLPDDISIDTPHQMRNLSLQADEQTGR